MSDKEKLIMMNVVVGVTERQVAIAAAVATL